MKKTIKLLSLINLIIVAFAVTLFLISILFQRTLAVRFFGMYPGEVLARFPVVPGGHAFYIIGMLGIAALHYFFVAKSKCGIWVEILIAIGAVMLIPMIYGILSYIQQVVVGTAQGSAAMAAYSVATSITSVPVSIVQFSASFLMLICGMGIVTKRLNKLNQCVE